MSTQNSPYHNYILFCSVPFWSAVARENSLYVLTYSGCYVKRSLIFLNFISQSSRSGPSVPLDILLAGHKFGAPGV